MCGLDTSPSCTPAVAGAVLPSVYVWLDTGTAICNTWIGEKTGVYVGLCLGKETGSRDTMVRVSDCMDGWIHPVAGSCTGSCFAGIGKVGKGYSQISFDISYIYMSLHDLGLPVVTGSSYSLVPSSHSMIP